MVSTPLNNKRPIPAKFVGLVILLIIFGILTWLVVAIFFRRWSLVMAPTYYATVQINKQLIKAEVATSSAAMYQGLSNRRVLCPACGLLFIFTDSQEREFVMRNMNWPLDIIFINQNRVISIAANLPPEGLSPKIIYQSGGLADQVLEVNGGYTKQQGIKVGDRLSVSAATLK